MGPVAVSLLLAASAALFAWTMTRRLRLLARLRPEARRGSRRARLGLLVRFGLGQGRLPAPGVRAAGLMHVALFASFLVLSLRTVTLFGQGFDPGFHLPLLAPESTLGQGYLLLKDLVLALALGAALGFVWLRAVVRPARLSPGWQAYLVLAFIAALMLTDLMFEGAALAVRGEGWSWRLPTSSAAAALLTRFDPGPDVLAALGQAGYWSHLVILLAFGNLLPYGKHFHVITALPNVWFGRLGPSARMEGLDLDAEVESFGLRSAADLTWKQGLDLYSCTECGRCQTHCPTHQTGKPLSHKGLNQTLRAHLLAQAAPLAAGHAEALPRLPGGVVSEETLWACTTCGWCESACPVLIENLPRLLELRRHQTLTEAALPSELARVFRALEVQGNPWGLGSNTRDAWAEGLGVPRAADGAGFEYLFFVGCAGAFDARQQRVSRAIVRILRAAGVEFAILGNEERCNGEAARRLGNELLFQTLCEQNVETLRGYGVKKILTQCPHCFNTLAHEYPDFGGRFEVVHHTELIAGLLASGRLQLARPVAEEAIAFHDPCYLGRHNGLTEAPRRVLAAAGARLEELPRSRGESFCCGAGGGRMWLEERLGSRISHARVEEIGLSGAGAVASACPFCLTMLTDAIAEKGLGLAARDVAEIVAAALPAEQQEDAAA